MVVLDANVILRYLLNDNEAMAREAESIIKTEVTMVPIEVIAEVVYVLKGVYAENNLDFVDCILYAYSCVKKYDIKTFDKKLNKLLSR